MNKEVPNDISAEQAVIGSMFLSKYALDKSLEALTSDSFYLEKHGKIFNAIKELHSKGTALDITTITSHLKDKNIIFVKDMGPRTTESSISAITLLANSSMTQFLSY